MKGYLLDTNLLIALLWPAHNQHEIAARWFATHRSQGWATCPLTQAGFIRVVSNPAFSRDAVHPRDAVQVLAANTASADHLFWSADIPVPNAISFAGLRLLGHQQVTDAYLLGLAIHRGGILATLDRQIGNLVEPGSEQAKSLVILG
jgi:toxin-antitoxin system PIN domain toxin